MYATCPSVWPGVASTRNAPSTISPSATNRVAATRVRCSLLEKATEQQEDTLFGNMFADPASQTFSRRLASKPGLIRGSVVDPNSKFTLQECRAGGVIVVPVRQ